LFAWRQGRRAKAGREDALQDQKEGITNITDDQDSLRPDDCRLMAPWFQITVLKLDTPGVNVLQLEALTPVKGSRL
jgi:hypothetical protein